MAVMTKNDFTSIKNDTLSKLFLSVENDKISSFFPVLQKGFVVKSVVGCSLKEMLCSEFGFSPDYVENRIKTIFLNRKPVDDVNSTYIQDSSRLALSGAMPGLVGATFRRGGVLASFRANITHHPENLSVGGRERGTVILKLFNLLVPEMGPVFLEKGIFIPKQDFRIFLESHAQNNFDGFKAVLVNGIDMPPADVQKSSLIEGDGFILLTISSD